MQPTLIHPIPIEIQQIDRASTFVDEDFGEPVENVSRSATVTVNGQVKWEAFKRASFTAAGVEEKADGFVTMRPVDLRAAGITQLQVNDRIVGIGTGDNKMVVDLYIVRLQPMGHYPSLGGPGLIRAYFRDRHPVKSVSTGMS